MIVKPNKITFINKNPFKLGIEKCIEEKIEIEWNKFIIKNKDCFNGNIYVLTNIKHNKGIYTIELSETKFATLVYSKNKNNNYTLYPFFSGILPKTKDNYYVLIRNNKNKVNCLGGMASSEDFINNHFSPKHCLERELKEELNLILTSKKDIIEYNESYLKIPNQEKNLYTTGVIYTGILNYTKEELKEYFNNNKDKTDYEIKELLFYTKDNYKSIEDEPIRADYIIELISKIESDKS